MPTATQLHADLRRAGRGVRRVLRLSPRELLTVATIVVLLAFVELVIRWMPLPRLAALLGVRLDLTPPGGPATPLAASELAPAERRRLELATRIADRWPLAQGPCLRRALVTGCLLRAHDPAVRIGVVGTGADLLAHAWLELDGRPLEEVADFRAFHTAAGGSPT